MDLAKFRTRFDGAIKRTGITRTELSAKAGVPYSTVSNWLNGVATPTVDALGSVCRVLDVSIDWIIGMTEDPRVIPFGQLLLDMPAVRRVQGAKFLDDIADLIDVKDVAALGFDVTQGTEMPPRKEAEKLLSEVRARIRTLKWKRR